jgi:hypothetical protein
MNVFINLFPDPNTLYVTWTQSTNCPLITQNYFEITLYRDNVIISSNTKQFASDTSSYFYYFENVGKGTFYVRLDAYFVEPDVFPTPPPSLCQTVTSRLLTNSILDCIPTNYSNMSFSFLRDFYEIRTRTSLELSGTNNPSTGDTIFGKSPLPLSGGSANKTRPNAVSELRGTCMLKTEPYFQYVSGFNLNSITQSGTVENASYDLTWNSINLGSTTSCPQNGYSYKIRLELKHFNLSGSIVNATPYSLTLLKNNISVGSLVRSAPHTANDPLTIDVTLNTGDTLKLNSSTQLSPFGSNCGRTLNYEFKVTILEAYVNSNLIPISGNIYEFKNLNSSPCNLNTEVIYSFNASPGLKGKATLFVNNVFRDAITEGTKSLFVPSSSVVELKTEYSVLSNPSVNTRISNTTGFVGGSTTTNEVLINTSTFLSSFLTAPSSGTAKMIMAGEVKGDLIKSCPLRTQVGYVSQSNVYKTDWYFSTSSTGKGTLIVEPFLSVPYRFQVIWNNNVLIDSGYIARNTTQINKLNTYLQLLGEPTVNNIGIYGQGVQSYFADFQKTSSNPSSIILRIFSPIPTDGTAYILTFECPR